MTLVAPATSLWLSDDLTTYAPTGGGVQTGYGVVGGVARIIDLTDSVDPWHGVAAFEPSILKTSAGDEDYLLVLEGSNTADFSGAKQDLASWNLGALNPQDLIAVSNYYDETRYRYVRLKIVVSGTLPQIRLRSFIKPLSDIDDFTLSELITVQSLVANNIHNATTNLRAWMAGTVDGGPNGDGYYPLSDGLGNTVMSPCPARMAADASGGGGSSAYSASNIDVQGGTEAALLTALANAQADGTPLTGDSGLVTITSQKSLTGCSVALQYKSIRFGHDLAGVLPTVAYPGGSQYAPVTLNVVGPAIEIGGSTPSPEFYSKVLRVIGDYPGDGSNQNSPFTAVRINGDQSSRSTYDIGLQNHRGDGLEINSDTEKKDITYQFNNVYERYALTFRSTGGASPDEVRVRMTGTVCSNLVYAQEQGQYSYRVDFLVENVRPWLGTYAIEDFSRKGTCYSGEIRGINGDLIKVETRYTGFSSGGPNVVFDSLRIIQHFCGRITIINPKSVGGTIYHDQVDNSRTQDNATTVQYRSSSSSTPTSLTLTDQPGFQIGAVLENCTLTYVTRRNVCPYGARIGIGDWVNPVNSDGSASTPGSAFSGKSIRLEIEMGDRNIDSADADGNPLEVTGSFSGTTFTVTAGEALIVGQFLKGDDVPVGARITAVGSGGTYTVNRTLSLSSRQVMVGATPDMFYAIWADYGTDSVIWADGNLQGNIRISSGWQRGTIHVSAAWVRGGYVVDFDSDAVSSTEILIHGPISFAEVTAISWAFDGLTALNVTDFGGVSMRHNGTVWIISRFIDAPSISTELIGSALNAPEVKRQGLGVIDETTSAILIAQGPARDDPWLSTAGGTVTPAYSDETEDFDTRQQAASGGPYSALSTDTKVIYDRLFHDLIYAGVYDPSDASTSLLKGLYMFNGPNEGSAITNLLFDFWSLTKTVSSGFTHTPKVGFVPASPNTGSYLEVSGFMANQHGANVDNDSIAIGACAEELYTSAQQSAAGSPYTIGSNHSDFRGIFHRSDGGNNVRLNATNALNTTTFATGSYRMGMGFTDSSTSQSITVYGGTMATSSSKTAGSNTTTNLYIFRAQTVYLARTLSMALIGQGTGWTAQKIDAALSAINLARAGLRAL